MTSIITRYRFLSPLGPLIFEQTLLTLRFEPNHIYNNNVINLNFVTFLVTLYLTLPLRRCCNINDNLNASFFPNDYFNKLFILSCSWNSCVLLLSRSNKSKVCVPGVEMFLPGFVTFTGNQLCKVAISHQSNFRPLLDQCYLKSFFSQENDLLYYNDNYGPIYWDWNSFCKSGLYLPTFNTFTFTINGEYYPNILDRLKDIWIKNILKWPEKKWSCISTMLGCIRE